MTSKKDCIISANPNVYWEGSSGFWGEVSVLFPPTPQNSSKAKNIHELFWAAFYILHCFLLELAAELASSYVIEGCSFRFTDK